MKTEGQIRDFSVQSVEIDASIEKVFSFIADPRNLPKWTVAFEQADDKSAVMTSPNGALTIGLDARVSRAQGTIDWYMTMPDGNVGVAYSRVVKGPGGKTIFSFTLLAPPVPVEQIEGTLMEQEKLLAKELKNLKALLE
jgi:Polyketide cyclase / dehydrase and lipid transport